MKLVLYSGGQNRENHRIHRELAALCGSRKRIRMTYVPFCSENANLFFQRLVRRYRPYGVTDFQCLPVDQPIGKADLSSALHGDIIYLAGGNTYYFLKHLKEARLLSPLRSFARNGGILAGLSAGALILTPNIQLAGIPVFDADENEVKLRDLGALSLVPFEFSPHYSPTQARDRALINYSLSTPHPIYACPDGGAIVLDGSRFTCLGKMALFHRGAKLRLWP